jgi:lipopolysaccharide biosynthesis regulator YciM
VQHRTDESYTLLTKAVAQGYESGVAHYILGTLSLQKGENQEAIAHLKKVSADRFSYRDLYLSIALRNCGKTKAADESYRNFLRRNPAPLLPTQASNSTAP